VTGPGAQKGPWVAGKSLQGPPISPRKKPGKKAAKKKVVKAKEGVECLRKRKKRRNRGQNMSVPGRPWQARRTEQGLIGASKKGTKKGKRGALRGLGRGPTSTPREPAKKPKGALYRSPLGPYESIGALSGPHCGSWVAQSQTLGGLLGHLGLH
jgi:hypothetical protein